MTGQSISWLKRASSRAADLLFPPVCVACDQGIDELEDGICLCEACRKSLKNLTGPRCQCCAARVPEHSISAASCHYCQQHKLKFDRTFCWGLYEGLMQDLIKGMKADVSQQIASVLGALLVEDHREDLLNACPDALIPIPMNPRRSQSTSQGATLSLALVIGRRLGIPVYSDLLSWKREVETQVGLSPPGRFRNVHRAMQVSPRYGLNGVKIMIVDDVLTTGATCSEAARALKRGGAENVSVLVAARAG